MFVPNAATNTDSTSALLSEVKPSPDDVFLFDRINRRYLTQSSRRMRLSIAEVPIWLQVFMLFFAVSMFVVAYQGGFNFARWLLTNTGSVTTEGRIIDRRVSRGKSTTYTVIYAFTINDQRYVVSQQVSYNIYNIATEQVDVSYWPANPNFARLTGVYEVSNMFTTSLIQLLCPGSFAIGMLLFAIYSFRDWHKLMVKQRHLREEGTLIYGEIVSSRGHYKAKQGYKVTIRYVFRTPDPDGRWVAKEQVRTANWLRNKKLPAKGTPVAVLYAADDNVEML